MGDRRLLTVGCLVLGGNDEQLMFHPQTARDNGAGAGARIEAITHAAFYAGCPTALAVVEQVFSPGGLPA